ncbi:MAG: S-methyl-5-thioribose-1-phosphate isomerase [Ignavibacteriales bacterium]|nr:S-methyl-5-thioribose-1-phosphate isomerase [Ignavibacteriales bacterium]
MAMQVIQWNKGKLRFLDQTMLPEAEVYRETDDPRTVADAIRSLAIRGAPLIGIAAAYGVVLAARRLTEADRASLQSHVLKAITLFASTRPTAVNLFQALERMKKTAEVHRHNAVEELQNALEAEALAIHEEDRRMCERIGVHGAQILPNAAMALTHCNTGMLATGGRGTALAVLQTAWEQGKLKSVYIGETRPLFQGARLTAWEMQKLQIPATLITDSTAGFLMQQGRINVVVVGADRIASNGDAANKIGTYSLAVLARHHEIPFYVAAPSTTVDFEIPNGKAIEIEQRSSAEVKEVRGVHVAPPTTEVYSPAFDVTPHELITGLITEAGVLQPPYGVSLCGLKQSRHPMTKVTA